MVAVVVTHDRLEHLRLTIGRLLATPPRALLAVVVVDNASSDGTGAWLAGLRDPRLLVLTSRRNLGGAGGFEWGLRRAVARFDPAWVVVMDDDARPDPGALLAFHAQDRSKHDAWAAAVRHPDGRICDINRPSLNPFWNRGAFLRLLLGQGRDGFHLSATDYAGQTVRAVDGASFVGLFLSRRAIALAGYPDGRLFVYGDDVLYTLHLRAMGGLIAFDPGLRFEHDFSTMHAAERRFRPLWKSYYHYRNLLIVYRQAAGWLFFPALLAVLPKWLLKTRNHRGERALFLRLLGRAVRDGLAGRLDVDHAEILSLAAGTQALTHRIEPHIVTDSGCRDDSAP
nr:glycosyltransferase [Pontibaca salina]